MKRKRLWIGVGLAAIVGAIALLVGGGLRDNVVYFLTPSELEAKGASVIDAPLRLGGEVKPGSVKWDPDKLDLRFIVTDGKHDIPVHSSGAPPSMFQDSMGVVVEGRYLKSGVFESTNLMVKHSNEYHPPKDGKMPKEMYRSLIREPSSGK